MSIAWGTLKALMIAAMDEVDIDIDVSRTAQMQWALRTFAQHTPYQGTQQYTVSSTNESLEVPSNFLDPRGVFFTGSSKVGWTPLLGLGSGALGQGMLASSTYTGIGWWLWPAEQLNVLNMVGTVDFYYYAHYPELTDEDDQVVPVPNWAVHPLIWLAIVYSSIPYLVSTAQLARWAETAGAKKNPIIEQIDYFQNQYAWELANHPIVEREIIVPAGS